MPQEIIDLLNRGADANRSDAFRDGNLICLPRSGCLLIAGDIHGNCRNFERIIRYADLGNNRQKHVILQEIIHGGPEDMEGGCLSYKLLFEAIRYKLQFPHQVHMIMGNHDTAFVSGSRVMKNGKEMNGSLRSALGRQFGQAGEDIKEAIKQFLFSQALAVRCDNRIWVSHSLPGNRYAEQFDAGIFQRALATGDLSKPGSAYLLTWGRKHSQELVDKMAKLFDVDLIVLGHQSQRHGWAQFGRNLIILTSEHNHGCLLSIDLAESYTIEQLAGSIIPLASIE